MCLTSHVIGWLFIRQWLPQFCDYWKYLWKSCVLKFGILYLHNMSLVSNINSHSCEYLEKEDCHMGLDMWCIDDGGVEWCSFFPKVLTHTKYSKQEQKREKMLEVWRKLYTERFYSFTVLLLQSCCESD